MTPSLIHSPVRRRLRARRDGAVPSLLWAALGGLCLCLCGAAPALSQSLQDSELALPGVWAGQAAWGDYDDDGDPDLALIGETLEDGVCARISQIFRNDGGLLVEDVGQTQRLLGVYYGDVGWADYDSDGDLDLAVAGWDTANVESVALYRNEPGGTPGEILLTFDIEQTEFTGVRYATLSWVDYDNDGDLDLVVSGMEPNGTSLTSAYRNEEGRFQFDELNSEALLNVHNGDLAWADYDSDGDLDLALSGENVIPDGETPRVTEFYVNEPVGSLNLDAGIQVDTRVKGGSLAWADYDTDGNPDLAVSGRDALWISTLQLYRNRPAGVLGLDANFTLNVFSTLDGALDWIDYDNDGFLELAVSGRTILSEHVAHVFGNDQGTVTSVSVEQNLEGLAGGLTVWGDYDGDGRADLLLGGVDGTGQRRTILYGNLGTPEANRLPDPPQSLQRVEVSSTRVRFSWTPGEDVESTALSYALRVGSEPGAGDIVSAASPLEPGRAGAKTSFVLQRFLQPDTYYWSVQSVDGSLARSEFSQEGEFVVGRFVSSDQLVRSLDESAMSWGDFDDDGDDDLAIMGKNRSGEAQTLIYVNRAGTLTLDVDADLAPLRKGDVAWADYDNDGDLDLMTTGEDANGNRANFLYRTDHSGSPDEADFVSALRFRPGLSSSSIDWGDVDNDGDIDLLLMGQSDEVDGGVQLSFTQLWTNDGAADFTPAAFELTGLNNGEALFGDVDGDGDLDVMTTGVDSQNELQAKLYRNLLPDELRDMGLSVPGMQSADIALGDYDRDGDLDLAAGGITATGLLSTGIYANDGVGGFEALADAGLPGIQGGDLAWADFDNDQDLDLVVAGNTGDTAKILQLYENTIGRTGAETAFTLVNLPVLQGVDFSSVSMADVDGDGDLDLISAGRDAGASQSTAVNDNLAAQQLLVNRPPEPPTALPASDSEDSVTLNWQAGSDDGDPPAASLTYNLRVGTATAGDDVLSGAIALGPGNSGQHLSRDLQDLPSGTYHWAVQTVDVGGARSAWSAGDPFVIDTVDPALSGSVLNRDQAGLGQTINLVLAFLDEHSGVDATVEPLVQANIGGTLFRLQLLQFGGLGWSGELVIAADMPSGEATLSVSGLVDLKGNALADTTFATFVVDTDLPAIDLQAPAAGAAGVAQTLTEMTIEFSEAIDPATVTEENFTVTGNNVAVPLRVEQPDEATVTLILEEALRPGSLYDVSVSAGIQDLAANRPADAISWSFTTEIPQLTGTFPADESADVALDDGRLWAAFDADVDLSVLGGAAIQVLRDEQAVALRGSPVFDADTDTLHFELDEGLLPGSRYRVVLSGLLTGPLGAVNQGDLSWRFTTAVPQLDTDALKPADGDTTVSVVDDEIQAVFDQPLDPEAVLRPGSVRLTRQGSLIETGTPDYNPATRTLSFAPTDGLQVGTRYAVAIDGSAGGPLRQEVGDYTWSFSTAVPLIETATPQGDGVSIADTQEATVEFSVPLDDAQVDPANFILRREGIAVPLRDSDPAVLESGKYGLAEAGGWRVGSSYSVSIAAAVQGPLGPGKDLTWQFQTAIPDTISVNPRADADTVSVTRTTLSATFDEVIDHEALLVPGNVVLGRSGQPVETGDPSYDPTEKKVSIPVSGLRAGSSYQVLIDASVAGPRAPGEFRWGFSTRIPSVDSTEPQHGASVAAGRRSIGIRFTSAVDTDEAENPANYRLTGGGGESIDLTDASISYDEESFTVRLPDIEFLSGNQYDVVVSSRLGGPLAQRPDDEFTFVTDRPTVVGTEPGVEAEGVSTRTAAITLRFSGPVARRDAAGFQLRARPVAEALANATTPFELLSITFFGLESPSVVNFAPEGGFAPFTEYEVFVDSTVFGPRAVDGYMLTFTTAARVPDPATGGTVTSADSTRSVELYFPPNALQGSTDGEVVIQPLEAGAGKVVIAAAKPSQDGLTQIGHSWSIDALGASLAKPVTLTMRYNPTELGDRDPSHLGIFRLVDADWLRVGGTADEATSQVQTSVEELGTFALFEDLNAAVGALAIAGIDVQPQAFAPASSRGNLRQVTDISFDLSGPADVTVRVYSASGRLERVVARDVAMAPGRNSLVWDGRDEDSEVVGSGLYIVVVSAGGEQAEKIVAVVR